jgi:hypothetical protein
MQIARMEEISGKCLGYIARSNIRKFLDISYLLRASSALTLANGLGNLLGGT